jgi:hypothetical protein
MPSVSHTQQVRAPVTVLWDQIQDLSLWAKDIPGYLSHQELSPDESVWTVQGDVGAMSRRVEFRVLVTERLEPRRISFTLTGLNENLQGSGSFEAHQDEETRPGQAPPPSPAQAPRRVHFCGACSPRSCVGVSRRCSRPPPQRLGGSRSYPPSALHHAMSRRSCVLWNCRPEE